MASEWFPEGASKTDGVYVCVIGGTSKITGAPYFAAQSAINTAADLVAIYAGDDESRAALKVLLPEAYVDRSEERVGAMRHSRSTLICCGLGIPMARVLLSELEFYVSDDQWLKNGPQICILDGDVFSATEELEQFLETLSRRHKLRTAPYYVFLTPNEREFQRCQQFLAADPTKLPPNVIVLRKGNQDQLISSNLPKPYILNDIVRPTTHRRTGGQGDMLVGILGAIAAKVLLPSGSNFPAPQLRKHRMAKDLGLNDLEPPLQCAAVASHILRHAYRVAERTETTTSHNHPAHPPGVGVGPTPTARPPTTRMILDSVYTAAVTFICDDFSDDHR